MWKKILIAYDGSDYANQALATACDIAKSMQATVTVLSVIKLPEPMLGLKPEVFIDDATKYYKQHFIKAIANCQKLDQEIGLEVVIGRPAESILNYAMQHKCDLVVIGFAKKKSLLDKLILGSIAKQVLDHAICSVLLVR